MKRKRNPSSKKNVEGKISEQNINMINLVKTMLKNFLGSDGDYEAITDIKTEANFGSDLQTDVEVPLSGTVRRKITYRKNERILIRPNAEALFLIVQDYV